jgi:hypothetical protein
MHEQVVENLTFEIFEHHSLEFFLLGFFCSFVKQIFPTLRENGCLE